MRSRFLILMIVLIAVVSLTSSGVPAQAPPAPPPPKPLSPCPAGAMDVSAFVDSRMKALTAAEIAQKNNTNQTQLPSVAVNSPSLVDQSSGSDLLGVGLNLIGVSSGSNSTDTTSTSATVSAFALRAALSTQDPLQTEYYNANAGWRRFFFTLGVDYPQQGSGAAAERGVIVGGKFLVYNERDITQDNDFGKRVDGKLAVMATKVATAVGQSAVLEPLEAAMCLGSAGEAVDESKIPPTKLDAIDAALKEAARAVSDYQRDAADLVKEVNNRPQVALEFLTNQRKGQGVNDYMGVLTGNLGWQSDLGFADSIALTMNGSYDFQDRPTAKDSQGGKFGAELRLFQASKRLDQRVPWTASIAGDGTWMTNTTPEYRVQGGVTIALFNGVDLPLSISWANKSELVKESQVIGNIGFTLDTTKLLASLHK